MLKPQLLCLQHSQTTKTKKGEEKRKLSGSLLLQKFPTNFSFSRQSQSGKLAD